MNKEMVGCPSEEQLLRALSNDELLQWSPHVEGCSACQAFIAVVEAIRHESTAAKLGVEPPSVQWILFYSELRRRREAAVRVMLPLRWVSNCGLAAGLIIACAVLYSAPTPIFGDSGWLMSNTRVASQPVGLLVAIATIPVMLLVTGVLRTIWAEE
jgi:hypothetical protein